MLFASTLVAVALAGISHAQTPDGFTPVVNTKLDVMFNSTAVTEPGQQLSKATTASQPQLAIMNGTAEDIFLFMMIDLDVPLAGGNTTRRTLLHALQPGFKTTSQRTPSSFNLLVSTSMASAPYIGPSPPANDTIPHRYLELLFPQPANFLIQAAAFSDIQSRIAFDLGSFVKENRLGEPVAANFFTVSGTAPNVFNNTVPSATGSGGIVRNTLVPFEGAAGRTRGGWLGLVVGIVVGVMVL